MFDIDIFYFRLSSIFGGPRRLNPNMLADISRQFLNWDRFVFFYPRFDTCVPSVTSVTCIARSELIISPVAKEVTIGIQYHVSPLTP